MLQLLTTQKLTVFHLILFFLSFTNHNLLDSVHKETCRDFRDIYKYIICIVHCWRDISKQTIQIGWIHNLFNSNFIVYNWSSLEAIIRFFRQVNPYSWNYSVYSQDRLLLACCSHHKWIEKNCKLSNKVTFFKSNGMCSYSEEEAKKTTRKLHNWSLAVVDRSEECYLLLLLRRSSTAIDGSTLCVVCVCARTVDRLHIGYSP